MGYISIVLNAHLPYIRHPERETTIEESWYFEALLETYIPMLRAFMKLQKEKVPFKVTLSISPTLSEMLSDSLLTERFVAYMENKIKLTERELDRTKNNPEFFRLSTLYFNETKRAFKEYTDLYSYDILKPLRELENSGYIEIITTGATHAFFPLLSVVKKSVEAQVEVAVKTHKRHFDKAPKGIWLPECGYSEGIEYILEENGISYFFLDSHGLLFGDKKPKYGVYAPVNCKNGVAAFGRDATSAHAVWSDNEGYPADPLYRDTYEDIGFNLPKEYLKPYLYVDDERWTTGIKYFSKNKNGERKIYNPEEAYKKMLEHADNFIYRRKKQLGELKELMDREPLVVCPYDAELFGHWWYEGIDWLENVVRKAAKEDSVKLVTPSAYLDKYQQNQVLSPSFSSWGNKGYSEVWLGKKNDWIYRHLHRMTERMSELADRFPNSSKLKKRALNQAAREVLLAQSSDWAFMMKMDTDTAYAIRRIKEHIYNFNRIYFSLITGKIEDVWLSSLEYKNRVFPDINYKIYSSS
ncbi:MAG: DUF1957 domain-containing protein [Spirochaetales bacterium]|nr:DUF1957 domain-containing protein [Spirochaetales bacterium]